MNTRRVPQEQWKAVLEAMRAHEIELESHLSDIEAVPDFAWQKDHIVVPEDVHDSQLHGVEASRVGPDRPGPRLMKVAGMRTRDAAAHLNSRSDLRDRIGLNNLMSICPVNLCPADEPTPIPPYPLGTPVPRWHNGETWGEGVRVAVIDTGLAVGWQAHPWLVLPTRVDGDTRTTFEKPSGDVGLYAGHGAFIAGVLRCVAPAVQVKVTNLFEYAGASFEWQVSNAIVDALVAGPDIISLSAGGAVADGLPHPAFSYALSRLSGTDTLLVAAAGNDGKGCGDLAQFFPAAFAREHGDMVVAVGALREDRLGRACFSNFDDFVSVFEDGEHLHNAFSAGSYTYHESSAPQCRYHVPPIEVPCTCQNTPEFGMREEFEGMAEWSGTSFSTPVIAARIARHMSEHAPMTARDAWAALRGQLATITDKGDDKTKLKIFSRPV